MSHKITTQPAHADPAACRGAGELQALFDAITDQIVVLDGDGRIVRVNRAFAEAAGRQAPELSGSRLPDVLGEKRAQDLLVAAAAAPRTSELAAGDAVFQISSYRLNGEGGARSVIVMKDITDVHRLKVQLHHADKLASIGQLVAGVAHEINNPLTGALAYTELLRMSVQDEEVRQKLGKIMDSAERCKKIVDNLLTFSRQHAPSKTVESVNAVIDRTIDLRSYGLRSANITTERTYDERASVFVDAQQLQLVLLNILMNAEQAIAGAGMRDGRIAFETRYDPDGRRMRITVTNNGPAIPPQVLPRIFDPFFTTKPVGVGTGLGLSIAHGIVAEHGGVIRAENTAQGVRFVIELPSGAAGA